MVNKKRVSFVAEIKQKLNKTGNKFSCFQWKSQKTDKQIDYRVSNFTLKISDPEMDSQFNDYLR